MTYAHTWLPLPSKDSIVPIGTLVKPWGHVAAVGMLDGERYYWFVKGDGKDIAMMPASVVEKHGYGHKRAAVGNGESQ